MSGGGGRAAPPAGALPLLPLFPSAAPARLSAASEAASSANAVAAAAASPSDDDDDGSAAAIARETVRVEESASCATKSRTFACDMRPFTSTVVVVVVVAAPSFAAVPAVGVARAAALFRSALTSPQPATQEAAIGKGLESRGEGAWLPPPLPPPPLPLLREATAAALETKSAPIHGSGANPVGALRKIAGLIDANVCCCGGGGGGA